MKLKILKSSVSGIASPDSGQNFYWDTELPNFGVRVTPNGTKSFIVQTRINGITRRITIGRFPGVTAEVARKQATIILGKIAGGLDPVAEKNKAKATQVTLGQALDHYLKVRELESNTLKDIKTEFKNTFEDWKKIPLVKISRKMVEKRYLERSQASKSRANSAMRYLRAVFNLAISEYRDSEDSPIIKSNPVSILSESKIWKKVSRRKTVLSPSDLELWVPAVRNLGQIPLRRNGDGKQLPKLRNGGLHGDFYLFCALTGCRKSEAQALKKSDVNWRTKTITFRNTKNHSDHRLPMTSMVSEILERRSSESPIDHVFGSKHEAAVPSNFRTSIARIKHLTGLEFTIHDLRRLAATSMERLGIPGYTIKAILNHKTGAHDVTGGYVQVDEQMILAALEKLEHFILSTLKK